MLKQKNLIFIGAPGAGKGTISNAMIEHYQLVHISTGDILRAEVAKGTAAGKQAETLMKSGQLVPDELVATMVENRLGKKDCDNGFILDGFPRTIEQAKLLNEALKSTGRVLDRVVYLEVPDELILQRLTARLNCRGCDAIYNKIFMPPQIAGKCDKCGSELYQRADDSLETAKSRLAVFYEQTQPLIDYYKNSNLLLTISKTVIGEIMAELETELNR